MYTKVTHYEKTNKDVTSGFPEMDRPEFTHVAGDQYLKKASPIYGG